MEHDLPRDCILQGYIDPWYSDDSSQGSCSLMQEELEGLDVEISSNGPERMAFPARMSDTPVVDGRLQDRSTESQVSV